MKLIVFDLDFTLWNAGNTWCDHTFPPYKAINGHIEDSAGNKIVLLPEVREILKELKSQKMNMAVASRTHEFSWALTLLEMFAISPYFTYKEIYPGSKKVHFVELKSKTTIDFKEMIFFDDEMRNIDDVSELGVKTVWVPDRINHEIIKENIAYGSSSGL